VAKKNDSSPVM